MDMMLLVIKMKKRHLRKGLTVGVLTLLLVFFLLIFYYYLNPTMYITCSESTLTLHEPYIKNGEAYDKTIEIPRGTKVKVKKDKEGNYTIHYNDKDYDIEEKNLAKTFNEAITSEYVYPRRLVNLRNKKDGKLTKTVAKKAEALKVVSIDEDDWDEETGDIRWYKVKKNGKEYWISGRYVETTKKLAKKSYAQNVQYSSYWDEYYGEGYSKNAYIDQVDYKPVKKTSYKENKMPEVVNALHVTSDNFKKNKDAYFKLKKQTKLNAIVVEIKSDEGYVFYNSDVCKKYLSKPEEALASSVGSQNDISKLVQEYQDHGYYVIARIVTFKDAIYASQNKKEAVTDKAGNLALYNDTYWPSAYSRDAWMYNVDIAKEAADMGFNEIQFDYVRFPDGTVDARDILDFKNTYDESKVAALQGFLSYAKEELESYHVYVAADVFAWPVVACDDQDIGQLLPALANVVDAISPMPYLDHFSSGSFGFDDPTQHPKEMLKQFTSLAKTQMKSIQYPAQYRSWIQGYDLSASEVKSEIKGIQSGGYDGYMIWHATGDLDAIDAIKDGLK